MKRIRNRVRSLQVVLLFTLLCAPGSAWTQAVVHAVAPSNPTALTPGEARTQRAFEVARKFGQPELYAFLKPMPKGADLHMHLSGAIYAETFLAEAVKQNLCVDPVGLKLATPIPAVPAQPADGNKPAKAGQPAGCASGDVPASTVLIDQKLYDALIDSFSMRGFVPSAGVTGHDQFFATFARFSGLRSQNGAWLDEVATRAAAQNEQYLEIMATPTFTNAATLGYKEGWPEGADQSVTAAQLATLRDALLADGLRDEVAADIKEMRQAQGRRKQLEHCTPVPADAASGTTAVAAPATEPAAACKVHIHFLYQVLRGFPLQQVFAQTLLGFETVNAELESKKPGFVGINFVMPEDGRVSMQDYHVQMQMLDYLHTVYPKVHISLHAGELAQGMVPPAGLTFHIREAIDLGHAERIGHGVDVLYEDHPEALLKEMADKHIMVEINLTSNDVILGITGTEQPLAAYRAAHVPVALSTDDEGVSRIDLTHEYVKGVEEQGLTYIELKEMARTSLEHAFLAGENLWEKPDEFTHRKTACAAAIVPAAKPTDACAAFLAANERAASQWELERRFAEFEAAQHSYALLH